MNEKSKTKQKIKIALFTIITLCYILVDVYFTKSLLSLTGIENIIRYLIIALFIIFGICYIIFGIRSIKKNKNKAWIVLTILAIIFLPILAGASYYINKIYNNLDKFTIKETSTYTSVLLALKEKEITSDSKLGMISNENDREGYILAKELIEKENLKNEIVSYDDFLIMLNDLYNEEIDAVFVSGDYKVLFGNEDKFKSIADETKIVYSYSKEMKTEESKLISNKKLTEPFTVLVLGVDSEAQGGLNPNAAFNGDTLMLITFNPNTLSTTMFSIPRDMYVPIACNHNRYNKINSAAAYGTNCVIDTVKQMTDIDIDYFVKVNFKGVVDLVETLGGVDVDVEEPDFSYDSAHKGLVCEQDSQRRFGENLVCITPGENVHLNGEQALAYARCRHLYLLSDIARNQHQQAIIEAVAKKLVRMSSFSDFENVLNTITNNIATNMQTSQILSFYQTIKNMLINSLNTGEFMKIQKTYLEYYGLNVWLPGAEMYTSALGYYPNSLKAITKGMKENLGLLPVETIKTFSYDYKNDQNYSSDVIGKGIYSGGTLQLMPDLSGQTVAYAENWASSNGKTLLKEFVESESVPGIIINQSVHQGTFLPNVSSVTIYISKAKTLTPSTDPDKKPDNQTTPDKENNTPNDKDTDNDPDNEPTIPGTPQEENKPQDTPQTNPTNSTDEKKEDTTTSENTSTEEKE